MTSRDTYDIELAKSEDVFFGLEQRYLEITKWHAKLQIDFWNELSSFKAWFEQAGDSSSV